MAQVVLVQLTPLHLHNASHVPKLAVGRSISEIANELFLSIKTVSTYRARVLEKMNLQTNAELTAYAIRTGLVQ